MSIDKENQIEEIAKEFCQVYVDPTYEDCELCKQGSNGNCDALKKLKGVIRKLFPEDSVVLSRKEYEKLNMKYISALEQLENKSKETAEFWYDKITTALLAIWKGDHITTEQYDAWIVAFNGFAKHFGVEVVE